MYHDTIRANLLYANTEASEPEIWSACESAQIADMIRGLPEGLDTVVGDRGHRLSGGEKQRVAIARAIVTQPDIIIADEPTGNLDPMNTYEIVQILKKINDMGTTIILTTHNKGVIDSLKRRVITMENGKIVRDDKEGKYNL
jgi:ATP-binding cassette subfamily B protein